MPEGAGSEPVVEGFAEPVAEGDAEPVSLGLASELVVGWPGLRMEDNQDEMGSTGVEVDNTLDSVVVAEVDALSVMLAESEVEVADEDVVELREVEVADDEDVELRDDEDVREADVDDADDTLVELAGTKEVVSSSPPRTPPRSPSSPPASWPTSPKRSPASPVEVSQHM